MPRPIPLDLETHFGLVRTSYCFLLEIAPLRGPVEGYTDLDEDITSNGVLFKSESGAPPSAVPAQMNLPTASIQTQLYFRAGGFDSKKVQLHYYDNAPFKLSAVNYRGDLDETVVLAAGVVTKADLDDDMASMELSPWAALIDRPQGEETSQGCRCLRAFRGRCENQVLHDGGAIADYTNFDCVVTAVASASEFTLSGVTSLIGWSNARFLGIIRATSGENYDATSELGAEEVVKSWNAGTGVVKLRLPLPYLPEVGDTFDCERGCDRALATCKLQPNQKGVAGADSGTGNTDNFRAEPYVLLDRAGATR